MKNLKCSLSKYLAQAGISSRRKVVLLVKSGYVTLNGSVVRNPAARVTCTDKVVMDGKSISFTPKIYLLLNKPRNALRLFRMNGDEKL